MNYSSLAKVADSLEQGTKTIYENREVVEDKNVLDSLDLKQKIVDKVNPIIIDEVFLKKLSSSSRDVKRKFLGRLSDSHRRRVLKSLKKIEDADNLETLDYVLLDNLLANVLEDPSDFNVMNVSGFVASKNFPESIKNLVEQITSGQVDLDKEAVVELNDGCDGKSRVFAFTQYNNEKVEESLENAEEEIDESLEGVGDSKIQDDSQESEEDEFELPEEEDLTEEDIKDIEDSAKKHIASFLQTKDLKALLDSVDFLVADYLSKSKKYTQVTDSYWSAFDSVWANQNTVLSEIKDTLDLIKDDKGLEQTLNKFFEAPLEDVDDVEDRSLISLFSEALESYAQGDDSKLQAIAGKTLQIEENQEDLKDKEDPEDKEDKEDTEDEVEETEEFDEDSESLEDSIKYVASAILSKKNVNKIIDKLSIRVPALAKYNFRVEDCCVSEFNTPEACDVVTVPLSIDEYYAHCPLKPTILMEEEFQNYGKSPVNVDDIHTEGNCISVGGNFYYPYNCNAEDLSAKLQEVSDPNEVREIITTNSVPLYDAYKLAAKYDYLPFIDSKFYKPNMVSDGWTFNERPACLAEAPEGNFIKRCREEDSNCHLFGVPYSVTQVF